jgi:hypothetical protein
MTDEKKKTGIKVCLSVGPIKVLVDAKFYRELSVIAHEATFLAVFDDEACELEQNRMMGVAFYLGEGALKDEQQQTNVPTRH